LCDHHEIVSAYPPEYGNSDLEHSSTVTADPRWVLGGRNPKRGHGVLRAFFCRSCGFTQWFVEDPETVPIGDDHRTEIVEGVKKSEPFR